MLSRPFYIPQKFDTIVSETESLMNDVRDLEEEVSEGLNSMKENLDDAAMDMSSKRTRPDFLP